ncbi:hypothetical protein [Chryseobacterium sp. CFBP8996]|uniref:hypothetical protein n=1 Tax=Chryseobacterium sp. CFBP8996 TaxID=3096529 RepID=UPI002A6AE10D|nr:hypothetical protein [Chryseobacterium sp. CFBP8996]MDY0931630.1 hypothetical protein [Chryseobacterium sp. CFBP8996]
MTKKELMRRQFKEIFLYITQYMDSDIFDEDTAEKILVDRDFKTFEPIWTELHLEQPYDEYYSKQIKNDAEDVYNNIPKELHHELRLAISEDYEIMANYLISGEDDSRIASMISDYMHNEIPTDLSMSLTDKSVQEIFKEIQLSVRISKLRERANKKRNSNDNNF